MIEKKQLYTIIGTVVLVSLLFSIIPFNFHRNMNMDKMREEFISMKQNIQGDLLPNGQYRCCLKKPCTYCIEKTPKHGEGAICDCLNDIVNGMNPCGECIGEILEGHGNPYLANYFPEALANKIGANHLDELKQIISEKYDTYSYEQ